MSFSEAMAIFAETAQVVLAAIVKGIAGVALFYLFLTATNPESVSDVTGALVRLNVYGALNHARLVVESRT